MDTHEVTGEIMNEIDWERDREGGCPMAIVQVGAGALLVAVVSYLSFTHAAQMILELWW